MEQLLTGAAQIVRSELMMKWEKQEKDKKKMLQYSYNIQKNFEAHEEHVREAQLKKVDISDKKTHKVNNNSS